MVAVTIIDEVAQAIIENNTCGYTGCTNHPEWKVELVRIFTTDGGEVELAGYRDIPINRVCEEHKRDKATHMQIANRCWNIILRSLEVDNPKYINEIHKKIRLKRFEITWSKV